MELDQLNKAILNFLERAPEPQTPQQILEALLPTGLFQNRKDPLTLIRHRLQKLRYLPGVQVVREGGRNYYLYRPPTAPTPPAPPVAPPPRQQGWGREEELYPELQQLLYRQFKIYSKILDHRRGKGGNNSRWLYPDLIGVQFPQLESGPVRELLKGLDRGSFCNFYSFEVKKEIKRDWDLKKSYFQALSNSGWANYSFLVVGEIAPELIGEVERLAQRFKVGLLSLGSGKILVPPSYQQLDYRTLDRLATQSREVEQFIQLVHNYLEADRQYQQISLRALEEFSGIFPGKGAKEGGE